METIIKINPSELNKNLLDKIKKYIGSKEDAEITISINDNTTKSYLRKESRDEYFARLNKAIENAENGNTIKFTAREFESFSSQLLGK